MVLFKDMFDLSNIIFRDFCYYTIIWIMFQASNIHEYVFAFWNKFAELKETTTELYWESAMPIVSHDGQICRSRYERS